MGIATFLLYQDAVLGGVMTLRRDPQPAGGGPDRGHHPHDHEPAGGQRWGASVIDHHHHRHSGFFIFLGLATCSCPQGPRLTDLRLPAMIATALRKTAFPATFQE